MHPDLLPLCAMEYQKSDVPLEALLQKSFSLANRERFLLKILVVNKVLEL